MRGNTIAASIATIATTQTTSKSVNPASAPARRSVPRRGDIGGRAATSLLPVRAERSDFISTTFSWQLVDIAIAPRIIWHSATFEIGPVPCPQTSDRTDQRIEAFGARRISPSVQIEQVEGAREALDLDLGGFHPRVAQVVE